MTVNQKTDSIQFVAANEDCENNCLGMADEIFMLKYHPKCSPKIIDRIIAFIKAFILFSVALNNISIKNLNLVFIVNFNFVC